MWESRQRGGVKNCNSFLHSSDQSASYLCTWFDEKMGLSDEESWEHWPFCPTYRRCHPNKVYTCPGWKSYFKINDNLQDLLTLPCRLGGLGLTYSTKMTNFEYSLNQLQSNSPIVQSILSHERCYTYGTLADQLSTIAGIKKRKYNCLFSAASQLRSSLPSKSHGFLTREGYFQLAVAYCATSTIFPPQTCIQEYSHFALWLASAQHSLLLAPVGHISHLSILYCPRGGCSSIHHNEISKFSTNPVTQFCHNVAVESHLQPLTG